MQIALRPMSLGEILDTAVGLYRRNFWLLTGIIVLAEVPLLLVQIVLPLIFVTTDNDASSFVWFLSNSVSGLMRWVFVDGIGAAALSYAVAQRYLGQPAGIFTVYRRVGASLFSLAGILLIFPLLWFAVFLCWILVPCLGWLTGAGVLVFLSMSVLPLVPVALVIERQIAPRAILRAWDLARRRYFWLLAFNIVIGVFGWLLAVGPSWVASIAAMAVLDNSLGASASSFYAPILGVSGTLFNMLFLPIQVGAWTLIYYDLRVRTEAFDLVLLAAAEPERANRWVFLPPLEKWVSGNDLARFLLTSLLLAGLFVLTYVLPIVLLFLLAAVAK